MDVTAATFNHLVLPAKVPGGQDADIDAVALDVSTRFINACDTLKHLAPAQVSGTISHLLNSLHTSRNLNCRPTDKSLLVERFQQLKVGETLIVQVVEQNAAILARRCSKGECDQVIFESFEASPRASEVLAAQNALVWDFPGRAAALAYDEFCKPLFQDSLAGFLQQASLEPLERFQASARKATVLVSEVRDTANPGLITQMLMPLLEAIGAPSDVPLLRKRVRDDVNLHQADIPWRRLPLWLILRVAAKRQLCLALGDDAGQACYKVLMCMLLSQLLADTAGRLSPFLVNILVAKLSRRMAKLETAKVKASASARGLYLQLLDVARPAIRQTIGAAGKQLRDAWVGVKSSLTMRASRIPFHTGDEALRLALRNSGKFLDDILLLRPQDHGISAECDLSLVADKYVQNTQEFTDRYWTLVSLLSQSKHSSCVLPASTGEAEALCTRKAEAITQLLAKGKDAYDTNTEESSNLILSLFILWMHMDQFAVKACPLLRDYRPVFEPRILDTLQLMEWEDMQKLDTIQTYLKTRISNAASNGGRSILGPVDGGCFAARYVAESSTCTALLIRIQEASQQARSAKEKEWEEVCSEYDKLTEEIESRTCVCGHNPDGSRNVHGCSRCFHWRRRKRLGITVHEDYLPTGSALKAAVIFELACPAYLAAYRDATWRMVDFGYPHEQHKTDKPVLYLSAHQQLRRFASSAFDTISMASAKKSFMQTHYKLSRGKVSLSSILLPLGADFRLYDKKMAAWTADMDLTKVTVQHRCGVHIPQSLRTSILPPSLDKEPDTCRLSSYDIQANQTQCPPNMSVHEFSAYQRVLTESGRRWPNILVELGASNMDFSSEETMLLVSQLSVQAGPQGQDCPFRECHAAFKEPGFRRRLIQMLDRRLGHVRRNWRESHCMELLVNIALRLCFLKTGHDLDQAKCLLSEARRSTLEWIQHMRNEVHAAADSVEAARAAMYGLWASLICRRTFAYMAHLETAQMDSDDLSTFVLASVALRENLAMDEKLSPTLRNMLVRDVQMASKLEKRIAEAIRLYPDALQSTIAGIWGDSGKTQFSSWTFLSAPSNRWVATHTSDATGPLHRATVLHFNFIEGHLLVNRKPVGFLPPSIRNSEDVKELFGEQHLLTYPSSMPGMAHMLSRPIEGHEVHFGTRGPDVIIRAQRSYPQSRPPEVLEFVPRRLFRSSDGSFDLPDELVEDCVHWLNMDQKTMEVRRKPNIWRSQQNNWKVDVGQRIARRNKSRLARLVDPGSDLFRQVAAIFDKFEQPSRLTVFQVEGGKLNIQLRRLNLSFVRNRQGGLHCRELGADIDSNQDAGTLHGLLGKIVVCDTRNPQCRSILIPFGRAQYRQYGSHVVVHVTESTGYGLFGIDQELGRLTCAPEPRLVYWKAYLHALTSFCLPDELTGLTGTEAAVDIMRSECSKPWVPLGASPLQILAHLQALCPRREYYPPDKKRFQAVQWDAKLTASIQHDSFQGIVHEILVRHMDLCAIAPGIAVNDRQVPSHLRMRGEVRRSMYERDTLHSPSVAPERDKEYEARDRGAGTDEARNVHQIVRLVRVEPFSLHMGRSLRDVLDDWSVIGGFQGPAPMEDVKNMSLSSFVQEHISDHWGSLVRFCQGTTDGYKMMFVVALLAFNPKADMDAVRSLAAMYCCRELRGLTPPACSSFVAFKTDRTKPKLNMLETLIGPSYLPFQLGRAASRSAQDDLRVKHKAACEEDGRRLARHISAQWPEAALSVDDFEASTLDVEDAVSRIEAEWKRRVENRELGIFVDKVQAVLLSRKGPRDLSAPCIWKQSRSVLGRRPKGRAMPSISQELVTKEMLNRRELVSVNDLLSTGGNVFNAFRSVVGNLASLQRNTNAGDMSRAGAELQEILRAFNPSGFVAKRYVEDLERSLDAFRKSDAVCTPTSRLSVPDGERLRQAINHVKREVDAHYDGILGSLSAGDDRFRWLRLGGLWPALTPVATLQLLRTRSNFRFGPGMKEALVSYAISLTNLQRLNRMRHALLKGDTRSLHEELGNAGHENWDPAGYPDWLLMELDSNLLIRPTQIDVAHAIITPRSRANSLLQMNMGQGKSSCIVPMVVSVLANKTDLARLIVPKALLLQTAQTLQSRIGYLVGREVMSIPFSRRTPTEPEILNKYFQLHRDLATSQGVLLTSQENILSFKLSGQQRLADGKQAEADAMMRFQSQLHNLCRDLLDESDFLLAVKTQLIYPSGPELPVDGHPHRWLAAEELLGLVESHVSDIQSSFPRGLQVFARKGFPVIHFLQKVAEEDLHRRLTNDVCNGRTVFLRLRDSVNHQERAEMRQALSGENAGRDSLARVARLCVDTEFAVKKVLLFRGLVLGGILPLCLKKRWNVQYGHHPTRDPVAVPFEAKGVPSEQAEFGHPDVAILLTCLSFYYSGLTLAQFRDDLGHVLMSDDPATEYERWTSSSDLPDSYRHWNVVNVEDKGQVAELWGHLRLDRMVINHYMNHYVFPRHAKQFGVKLQASAWDLPMYPKLREGERREARGARSTGFSGTNDNKLMLPLNIRQDDLPALQQTNAEVLTYLLQRRSRGYRVAANAQGRMSEEQVLEQLSRLRTRVLIDAGAFILEMSNEDVARAWLTKDGTANAAVYFGNDHRACVMYRNDKEVHLPLVATPLVDNLDECVVYFDEAHTRGIDLRLPAAAVGAVTLALGQTKDHTVQAAMRLRQLGTTQSVVFWAPPEVDSSIRDVCKLGRSEDVNSSHVVSWLLEQTCGNNADLQQLYLAQGSDFCQRIDAEWRTPKATTDHGQRATLLGALQHQERQDLEELYGVNSQTRNTVSAADVTSPELKAIMDELAKFRGMNDGSRAGHSSALEVVEQERELHFEVEEIREVQKTARLTPLKFPGLHPAVEGFARTGHLAGADGYVQVFDAISRTGLGREFGVSATTSRLYVSAEFERTIKVKARDHPGDNYLRSVEWVLWSTESETGLVIIPEEAELLIPRLRRGECKVHLIAYAAPLTKSMCHFNNLSYYTLPLLPAGYHFPAWFTIELGIFAGRLYPDFAECAPLRQYLAISDGDEQEREGCEFAKNAAGFLLEWLALRRKAQDILHTPMAYICLGRPLHEHHAFFAAPHGGHAGSSSPDVDTRSDSARAEDSASATD